VCVRILFIGDIFGRAGRHVVAEYLPNLARSRSADLVIANGENAAAGFGLTPQIVEELLRLGIDVITTGNHVWDKREIIDYFEAAARNGGENARRVLRPANYSPESPGWGMYQGKTRQGVAYAVINLQGRVFMSHADDPFHFIDELLEQLTAKVILVDFHAEATSEKVAMGWHLDGRVTAVIGTHTHVPTADERVLPHGTAYITDVGMSGPYDSVIGVEKQLVLHRFRTGLPTRWEAARNDPRLSAVFITCDEHTGRAQAIERIMLAGAAVDAHREGVRE
jgi:2',3'-cyclic-nucleotide 2'-phosphodiesterase